MHRTFAVAPLVGLFLMTWLLAAVAQSGTAPAKKAHPNPYGSPLDTLMSTHLWTDVPPAQDFVKEARPDAKSLDYTPLHGKDPDRPKPRDPANVMALQAEMEKAATENNKKGFGPKGAPKPAAAKHGKSKAAAAR